MPSDPKQKACTNGAEPSASLASLNTQKAYPGRDEAGAEKLPNFRMRTAGWEASLPAQEEPPTSPASLNFFEPLTVCSADDRVHVGDTTGFPFKCIASLYIEGESGRWTGTGFFISPRCLITNGHVVFPDRKWAKQITVVPGRNGQIAPFGSQVSKTFFSVDGWTEGAKGNPDYDYGAIILPDASLFSRIRAHFGFAVQDDPAILNNSGYPGDKPRGTQWFNAGPVVNKTPFRFFYMIDTVVGQSGSPVWVAQGNDRVAVGVHGYGGCPNSAIRCTEEVALNWANWSQAQ
jgi:glutamyl endopeptidase